MADEHSYAMLATLDEPIRTQLGTSINIRNTSYAEIILIEVNPHTRIIMERKYHPLFEAPGTQTLAPYITFP